MLLGVVALTTYAVHMGNLKRALVNCDGGGHDCDRSLRQMKGGAGGGFVSAILLIFYPTIHLAFIINIKGFGQKCRMCFSSQRKTVSHHSRTVRSQLSNTKL